MKDAEICAQLIEEIANHGRKGDRFPIMSGTIVAGSFDATAMTVSVQLSCDDVSAPTENVAINGILNNTAGVYMVPADGANCLVAEVDGPGKWAVLMASSYVKVVGTVGGSQFLIKDGLIQFNDGSLGGLVEIEKLKDNLKALHDYIKNTLEPAINNGISGVGAGGAANGATGAGIFETAMTGQDIIFEDMENKKVTHG